MKEGEVFQLKWERFSEMGYRESAQNQVALTDSLNPLPPHLVKNKRKRTCCAF